MINTVKHIWVAALIVACTLGTAHAVEPFKITDIKLEGLERVEPGTVFSYLPLKVGDTANDENIKNSIQSIFATGFFSEINIEGRGTVLVVKVAERPFIASVTFAGNKEFDADELKKAMREVGLAEGRVFDRAVLARAEQELKRMYLARSKYGLKVTSVSSPSERNRVNVRLELSEGDIARIKEIRILGNRKFTQSQLRDEINSSTPTSMSWLTKSDRYAKEKLNADLESLRNFYLNRGYFDMRIESSQVSLSPSREDVFITVVIREGEQFRVGKVEVKAPTQAYTAEFTKLLTMKSGEIFNAEKLEQVRSAIQNRLGELGFAQAQVNINDNIDYEKRSVDFEILTEPGFRTYVRRINIEGNTRTRDEVIRREFRQLEAAWYEADKIKLSRDRIDRLGYFKDVNIDSRPVDGRPDQVDITLTVVEKPTGSIQFGVGFDSSDKVTFSAGISQDNIFGTGHNFAFNFNTASNAKGLSLSATDPYFTSSGVSRSFELYWRTNKQKTNDVSVIDVISQGGSVKFGFPINELNKFFVGLGFEQTEIKPYSDATTPTNTLTPVQYLDFFCAGAGPNYGAPNYSCEKKDYPVITSSWENDGRDSALVPSRGMYNKLYAELGAGSDVKYIRSGYQFQLFQPITRTQTLAFNLDLGFGKGLGSAAYPFFKNYYVGGIGSVRGYQAGTLGKQQANSVTPTVNDNLGGSRKLVLNAEYLFPIPGTGNDRTARLFTFVDAGYAWFDGQPINFSDMRYSTGLGLSWLTPIGPLKFALAFPLNKKSTDKTQRFQFQIGTGF